MGSRNRSARQPNGNRRRSALLKSAFSGVRRSPGPGVPAARHSAPTGPHGVATALCARRRGERARSSPGRGGPTTPSLESRSAAVALGLCLPGGVGSHEPGARGGGLGAPGGGGRAERRRPGRQPGGSARVRGCLSPAYLSVCRSVGVGLSSAPRGRGARQGPRGERAPLTCSRRCRRRRRLGSETGAQPPGSSSLASSPLREPRLSSGRPLVGAGEEARGAAAVSSLAASSKSHPRALPSLAGCRDGSGPARAGGGGGAAEGGERAGGRRGVLFGDGAGAERERREDRPTPKAAPGTGRPGRASCLLPPRSARAQGRI